jgi:hypothetical protein
LRQAVNKASIPDVDEIKVKLDFAYGQQLLEED